MTGYLLDTNVVSELRRPKPNPRVRAFVSAQLLEQLFISSVTLAEIRFGIESATDLKKRSALTAWLTHRVRPIFDRRVIEVSEDVMFTWRVLVENGRKEGHTFSQPDLIIAASALHHDLTVATRNVRDFELAGVPVVNPWTNAG